MEFSARRLLAHSFLKDNKTPPDGGGIYEPNVIIPASAIADAATFPQRKLLEIVLRQGLVSRRPIGHRVEGETDGIGDDNIEQQSEDRRVAGNGETEQIQRIDRAFELQRD